MAGFRQKHMTDALVHNCVYLILIGPPFIVFVIIVIVAVIPVTPIVTPPTCVCSYHVTRNIWFPSSFYRQ